MKKPSCRMTPQEKEIHKAAGKYRRMTDAQLVGMIDELKRKADTAPETIITVVQEGEQTPADTRAVITGFINALAKEYVGKGNGVGLGTVAKLRRIEAAMPDEMIMQIQSGEIE